MNESDQVTPRQPRGVLSKRGIRLRLSPAELLIICEMAKKDIRSEAAMCRMLILDGLASRGIEVPQPAPEQEPENIEKIGEIEVGQENIPQGDAK